MTEKKRMIIFSGIVIAAACCIILGLFRNEVGLIFNKATAICLECIGLGR